MTVNLLSLADLRSASFWMLTPVAVSSWRIQDQTEWQIEWQTVLVRAYLRLAGAGLCSCSGWSCPLPAVTEPAGHSW